MTAKSTRPDESPTDIIANAEALLRDHLNSAHRFRQIITIYCGRSPSRRGSVPHYYRRFFYMNKLLELIEITVPISRLLGYRLNKYGQLSSHDDGHGIVQHINQRLYKATQIFKPLNL